MTTGRIVGDVVFGVLLAALTGSECPISMNMFSHGEVRDACRANGWSFVGDGSPRPGPPTR